MLGIYLYETMEFRVERIDFFFLALGLAIWGEGVGLLLQTLESGFCMPEAVWAWFVITRMGKHCDTSGDSSLACIARLECGLYRRVFERCSRPVPLQLNLPTLGEGTNSWFAQATRIYRRRSPTACMHPESQKNFNHLLFFSSTPSSSFSPTHAPAPQIGRAHV